MVLDETYSYEFFFKLYIIRLIIFYPGVFISIKITINMLYFIIQLFLLSNIINKSFFL